MTDNPTTECPRDNDHCGYKRGPYCSLWETCADLAEMARQLAALESGGAT